MPLHTGQFVAHAQAVRLGLFFTALFVPLPGCGEMAATSEDDSALTAPESVVADADSDGTARVRASTLTLTFSAGARIELQQGERTLIVPGSASRNIKEIRAFVPDDAFGSIQMRGPRSFDLVLHGDHEINTALSGMPLRLGITTESGSPSGYEAALTIGARIVGAEGSTSLRPVTTVRPVYVEGNDPLRHRVRLETTKTPDSVEGTNGTVLSRSPRRFDLDWTYDAFALLAASVPPVLTFTGHYGASVETTSARISLGPTRLALTTRTIDQVWPNACASATKKCIASAAAKKSGDFGECGDYRAIVVCDGEEPPAPNLKSAEVRIAGDILAKTGQSVTPTVVEIRPDGARSIALTLFGRGGAAEFALEPNNTVTLVHIVRRPSFVDGNVVERFEPQLSGQPGLAGAKIIAAGSVPGVAPRWQFVVERNGSRATVALEATSATTSKLLPFSYVESAFREMAEALVVERGIAMASNIGLYGELEVYLKATTLFSTPAGLDLIHVADSPVGFNAAKEVQLGAFSVLGDNAIYVTIDKASGATRVDDFN